MNRLRAAIGAALIAASLVACSSESQVVPRSASVKINGREAVRTQAVQCTQLQWLWLIDIRDKVAGTNVFLDGSGPTPTPKSVHIRNLGGFTGAYIEGDGGKAN